MIPLDLIPLLAVFPIVLAGALADLRWMRIPNGLVLAAGMAFIVAVPFLGQEEAMWRLLNGAIAFAVCFALFAGRIIGGGDAKFFPVLILFVPPGDIAVFMAIFAASIALCMMVLLPVRRLPVVAGSGWKGFNPDGRFPMGTAFAAATLKFLAIPLL